MKLPRNTLFRARLAGAVLSLGVASLVGCDSSSAPAVEAPPAPEPVKAAEKAVAAPEEAPAETGPAVNDATFDLVLAAAGPYKAGELGRVTLTLTPKGIYHVNQEYPLRIDVTGPSELTLPKGSFEKPDAAEWGEKVAKFDIPFTPTSAGEHKLAADVDFAVCTEETCVPDRRKLALALTVE